MRIRTHLLLLSALVLAPSLLAAIFAVGKLEDEAREAGLRGLRETVRATSLLVDGQIQGSLGAMKSLGNSKALARGALGDFYEEAKALDEPDDVWTFLLDSDGNQRINTRKPFDAALTAPPVKEIVGQVIASGRPAFSDLFVGPISGRLHTMFYAPVAGPAAGRWVVAQAYAAEHWEKSALQPEGHPDWVVAVLDRSGRFVARSKRSAELLGKPARPELVAAAAARDEGVIRHTTLDGAESYDAYAHSSLTGWTIAAAAPVESIDGAARRSVAVLAGGVSCALLLGLLGAFAIGRAIVTSMRESAAFAGALGADPSSATLAPPRTSLREIRALNETLSIKARELVEESRARMAAEGERERLLDAQTRARVAAEKENSAKDRFIAQLGHEIRNPLSAITGAIEALPMIAALEPKAARLVEIVKRQNGHLKRIVDDLLDVGRMLSGKVAVEARLMDLGACVEECLEAMRGSPAAAGHVIESRLAKVVILGDAVRLEQVVSNLVGNALKFSPLGDDVRVEVWEEGGSANIRVSDDGPGIDSRIATTLFDAFVQGRPRPGIVSSGLGIGLSLVRQIVELHGGTVAAATGAEGVGAVFEVRLPTLSASPGAGPIARDASGNPA